MIVVPVRRRTAACMRVCRRGRELLYCIFVNVPAYALRGDAPAAVANKFAHSYSLFSSSCLH